MGKVRRLRQKYHASVSKKKVEDATKDQDITNNTLHQVPRIQSEAPSNLMDRDNIFAGLQIKLQKVEGVPAPSHAESDNMSVTSVSQQSQLGTKADKRKKRRQELLEKIDVVRARQLAEKDRKKREKTVITGDMNPLLNALPSLGELMESKNKKKSRNLKTPSGTPKQKTAKKEALADIQMFTSIHQDPHFVKDPFRAVALAIENRVLCEED